MIFKIDFYNLNELKNACNDKDIMAHAAGLNSQNSVKNELEALFIKENLQKSYQYS